MCPKVVRPDCPDKPCWARGVGKGSLISLNVLYYCSTCTYSLHTDYTVLSTTTTLQYDTLPANFLWKKVAVYQVHVLQIISWFSKRTCTTSSTATHPLLLFEKDMHCNVLNNQNYRKPWQDQHKYEITENQYILLPAKKMQYGHTSPCAQYQQRIRNILLSQSIPVNRMIALKCPSKISDGKYRGTGNYRQRCSGVGNMKKWGNFHLGTPLFPAGPPLFGGQLISKFSTSQQTDSGQPCAMRQRNRTTTTWCFRVRHWLLVFGFGFVSLCLFLRFASNKRKKSSSWIKNKKAPSVFEALRV